MEQSPRTVVGSTVYVAGAAGRLARGVRAYPWRGAVLIGDMNHARLAHAKSVASSRSTSPGTIAFGELVADSRCSGSRLRDRLRRPSKQRRKEQTARSSKRLLSC